jgi:multiple RNA-binding domain-containing protein 1
MGRLLHVLPSKPEPTPAAGGLGADASGGEAAGGGKRSDFQKQQEAKRKAQALSGAEEADVWNALFLRSDTVLAAAADKLGMSRAEVLLANHAEGKAASDQPGGGGAGAASMAVRMALAETSVVAETRAWLREQGVNTEALSQGLAATAGGSGAAGGSGSGSGSGSSGVTRSECVILVKNLPYESDPKELTALFGRRGGLLRLLVPPSKALALAEFNDPKSAKKAFAALAYSKYKRVPLYLEWAHEAALIPSTTAAAAAETVPAKAATGNDTASAAPVAVPASSTAAAAVAATAAGASDAADPADSSAGSSITLFVKNLSFRSDEAGLRAFVTRALGKRAALRAARIPRKRAKTAAQKLEGEWLSMGYGFLEFGSRAEAILAMKELQGRELDGHALHLSMSEEAKTGTGSGQDGAAQSKRRKTATAAEGAAAAAAGDAQSTKLLVRNLAFEATKSDLAQLFAPFGSVKTIRLPKKTGERQHRGFGFVDFLTHAEAQAAKQALTATHLYGRHLVLEWAAEAPSTTAASS